MYCCVEVRVRAVGRVAWCWIGDGIQGSECTRWASMRALIGFASERGQVEFNRGTRLVLGSVLNRHDAITSSG